MHSAEAHGRSKRERLLEYLLAHLYEELDSADLHIEWGSSLRARLSELRLDAGCPVDILNRTTMTPSGERSVYIAVPRTPQPTLFPLPAKPWRDDG